VTLRKRKAHNHALTECFLKRGTDLCKAGDLFVRHAATMLFVLRRTALLENKTLSTEPSLTSGIRNKETP
jgi:hypothetical protein